MKENLKVLMLNGSPKANGNTAIALREMENVFKENGIEVENIVIGNEGKGVSRLVKEKCDFVASIPMFGDIDSLNASVATGVLAYEIVRQRMGK